MPGGNQIANEVSPGDTTSASASGVVVEDIMASAAAVCEEQQ